MCRSLIPGQLNDTDSTGAAWVAGRGRFVALGLGLGLVTGLCACALPLVFKPHMDFSQYGPLVRMAYTPGWPRRIWLLSALLLAPFIEEALFRGVLYGGFRKSFGPLWAAAFTTGLFAILHVQEVTHYWPAMIGIVALALVALWCRLRAGAIGPAIAAHVGYNAVLALLVLVAAPPR